MDHEELERRRRPRAIGVVGFANLLVGGEWSEGWTVRDLSAGGAMLIGSSPLAPGDRVEVAFEAEGDRLTGLCLRAEVRRCVRILARRYAVAVVFRDVPTAISDHIHELVLAALDRMRANAPPTILVIDRTVEAQLAVTRDVGSDRKVVSATTLREMVRHLHDPDLRIEAALVDSRLGDADGLAILAHLAERYPAIRRILMSDRARTRNYESELASGRAHAFLTKPRERECLAAALSMVA